jgi:EPS-associated MarR family transcriptional regulator
MQVDLYLKLLNLLQENPSLTQRQISDALKISLGKTNYCLKALKAKGWVKCGNFSVNPNKLMYMNLLTPTGISEKLGLTLHFLKCKQKEYEDLRKEIIQLQADVTQNTMHAQSAIYGLDTLNP